MKRGQTWSLLPLLPWLQLCVVLLLVALLAGVAAAKGRQNRARRAASALAGGGGSGSFVLTAGRLLRLRDGKDGLPRLPGKQKEPPSGATVRELPGSSCRAADVPQPNEGIAEPPGLQGCPSGMARLEDGSACIDRWEAHLVQVHEDGGLSPWSPFHNPGGQRVRARSAPGAVPQGYINEVQASAACAEASKRLCRREEWQLACRGREGRTYPYGDERLPGECNDARARHPAIELFGRRDREAFAQLDHSCINQLPDGLARTGDHPGCVTPGGIFDLMGNLHEWIADPQGTFQGGFYVDTVGNGPGCLYRTTAHIVHYWDYSTGFRCCADR